MPRKQTRNKKPKDEYALLCIRVEGYDAQSGVSINLDARQPQYGYRSRDDDPLYPCTTYLTITGAATYPEDRVGDRYALTIYGDDSPSSSVHATLKDAQARNKYGSPEYRQYRGREIPVYTLPTGLGLIEKVRGQAKWTAWIRLPRPAISDMLVLLGHRRQLHFEINERKAHRARWVRSITLQTTDPTE